jgi:excisionase family DNA binding protein
MAARWSVAKMAEHLGVSRGVLYALARQHKIPYIKIGDRILFNPEKVEAALEVQADGPDSANRPLVIRTKGHG